MAAKDVVKVIVTMTEAQKQALDLIVSEANSRGYKTNRSKTIRDALWLIARAGRMNWPKDGRKPGNQPKNSQQI